MDRIKRVFVSRVSALGFLFVAAAAAVLLAQPRRPPEVTIARPRPIVVRGYIAVSIGRTAAGVTAAAQGGRDVYLPGLRVYLEGLTNNTKTDVVLTDLSGRFNILAARGQRYRVCWDSPTFGSGCGAPFSTTAGHTFLSAVRIPVPLKDKQPTVYGAVSMDDGSLPRALDPLSNVNSFARVELVDNGGKVIDTAFVNNFGEYVLAHVPAGVPFILRATAEGAKNELRMLPQANLGARPFHQIDLKLGNTPPRIEPIVAVDATGRRVKFAAPGSTVSLRARADDRDGDKVRVRWTVAGGSGSINTRDGDTVEWTLPNSEGTYQLTAVAYDGKGGYARSNLSLRADSRGVPFSGFVRGTDAPFIDGAVVEINGATVKTSGPRGYFILYVKDADRYVFNIRKRGYGFYSKIYDNGVTDGVWTLTRATVSVVDPTRDIDVVNERRPSDCPGSALTRLDWREFGGGPRPVWQDGKGYIVRPTRKSEASLPPLPKQGDTGQRCGKGIRVHIPANSIVDADGRPPAGNVEIETSTVDLASPEQMPGDESVESAAGTTRMESYGAGVVDIFGPGSKRYNVRPGVMAELTIPVDPTQLAAGVAAPPATIPILLYDEKRGIWTQEGTATLAGNEYKLKVPHFTPFNCDTLKVNPACVRVLSPTLPASYRLEVTIPLGGGAAPRVIDHPINNASPSEHVLYNLPTNTNIVVVPYVGAAPIGTFVVNTGGAMPAGTPNLPPGPPYAACQATLTLSAQTYPDAPLSGEFLQGLSSFEATNLTELTNINPADPAITALDQATVDYYAHIDPRGLRTSLANFISHNNMGGPGEIRVAYANGGDLGFGRDMHCVRNTVVGLPDFDVACYVTNFGDNTTSDETDAFNAFHQIGPGATVAMEYSRVENPLGDPSEFAPGATRTVKFYVFAPGGGASLLHSANLDGYGERPIPQLCMVCHNGAYTGGTANVSGHPVPGFASAGDVDLGARFLPFDVHFYKFDQVLADAAQASLAAQQGKFKQLNRDIVAFGNPGPAITELTNIWYPGMAINQDENALATGWNTLPRDQNAYRQVVARACRTCHVAQVFASLQFKTTAEFTSLLAAVDSRVCGQHVMPHARVTHSLFWHSIGPHMPAQLDAYGTSTNPAQWTIPCGAFTPATPPGAFAPVQTVINTYGCGGCHSGGAPPANLNLNTNPYAAIVNVPSTEKPSMMRIAPGTPNLSWLFHKIANTQGSVPGPFVPPGPGGRMPLGCGGAGCVSAGDLTIVQNWITGGANP